MFLEIVLLVVFLAGILFFSRITTDNAVHISNILGTSYTTIGFVMVAISTAQPELFVGIESAILEDGVLSVNNVLGSCITNIALIFGLIGVLYGFRTTYEELKKNSIFLLMTSALPLIFLVTQKITVLDGTLLILLFVFHIYSLLKNEITPSAMISYFGKKRKEQWHIKKWQCLMKNSALFLIGIFGTIFCAKEIVSNSLVLVNELNIPLAFIGSTIIAVGTSLPELVINMRAIQRGYREMAFGGLIGSCVIDLTLVLGVTAVLANGIASIGLYLPMVAILVLINLIFMHSLIKHEGINRKYGFILLILFAIFLIYQVTTLVA